FRLRITHHLNGVKIEESATPQYAEENASRKKTTTRVQFEDRIPSWRPPPCTDRSGAVAGRRKEGRGSIDSRGGAACGSDLCRAVPSFRRQVGSSGGGSVRGISRSCFQAGTGGGSQRIARIRVGGPCGGVHCIRDGAAISLPRNVPARGQSLGRF